ncbi:MULTISPECIES: IclR family transcriptional regulator [unclassified Rhodococcus (in: high G+C Gram-positive bacteria)]|uniref:IclR family transcriptional regulator n=1 Tax=unclassified Rhodococcus (in: high G+C Gram-positive bacteria) TaxID=192944 RepID=UPI00289846A2|nr:MULTISPECIES: IclR family transcriptional regulator [unclassified Rhodococcus (in: high G+C Gram-positive bacteria)]
MKDRPTYAVTSVDHALKIVTMLQLEGELTVSVVAARLGVARSTAHRLLQMLVYRDFAVKDDNHVYRPGAVLELAAYSRPHASRLRAAAMIHLRRLVDLTEETANLAVRTNDLIRFIAAVECQQVLRVSSREGMVIPAHRTAAGLLLLAPLSSRELETMYPDGPETDSYGERPNLRMLRRDLQTIRRNGFAVNVGRFEKDVVAVGVPVRGSSGDPIACLTISMPKSRYIATSLPAFVTTLNAAAKALEADLSDHPSADDQPLNA